jgi:hypothetical protein
MYSYCDLYSGPQCKDLPPIVLIMVMVIIGLFMVWNRQQLSSKAKGEFYGVLGSLALVTAIYIFVPMITRWFL